VRRWFVGRQSASAAAAIEGGLLASGSLGELGASPVLVGTAAFLQLALQVGKTPTLARWLGRSQLQSCSR
jgi:hypothetical protein